MADFQHFKFAQQDDVNVLTMKSSRIHDQEDIKELSDELNTAVAQNESKKFLLNMEVVSFLSSAILNRMIVLDKKLTSESGQLAFCNLSNEVSEVFSITRLDRLFKVFESQNEAIAAMK